MAISNIAANGTGAVAVTGGAVTTYTSIGSGRFSNLSALLQTPEYMDIESTVTSDGGKVSSYLIKLRHYSQPSPSAPYGSPDPLMQVHAVIKVDTSVFTEAQIKDAAQRLGHILCQGTLVSQILRGDR